MTILSPINLSIITCFNINLCNISIFEIKIHSDPIILLNKLQNWNLFILNLTIYYYVMYISDKTLIYLMSC